MNTFLKDATKEYFGQHSLSETRLDALDNILKKANEDDLRQTVTKPVKKDTRVGQYFNKWVSIAAVLVLTVSSILFLNPPQSKQGLIIAKEVIKNHIRLRPLEVSSDNFSVVGDYFTQLDFNLTPSQLITTDSGLKILGGRYCSIQSEIAAQIRYQDKKGHAHTLYQTGYTSEIFDDLNLKDNLQPKIFEVDGFRVSIWLEKGLLMANVSPY